MRKDISHKLEIVRLVSLCRYAAQELRALDRIIMQRHPRSSGLSESLLESLDGVGCDDFADKYEDLKTEKTRLQIELQKLQSSLESEVREDFEDLEIEIR